MALTGDTGNGATLTLPGSYSVALITISPGTKTLPTIDSSTLATTGTREQIPGDINDVASFKATFKWIASTAEPALGTVGTCTLTYPALTTVASNAANYSGTGFLTSWKQPEMANNTLQVGELEFQFDGDTGPTYTAAA